MIKGEKERTRKREKILPPTRGKWRYVAGLPHPLQSLPLPTVQQDPIYCGTCYTPGPVADPDHSSTSELSFDFC